MVILLTQGCLLVLLHQIAHLLVTEGFLAVDVSRIMALLLISLDCDVLLVGILHIAAGEPSLESLAVHDLVSNSALARDGLSTGSDRRWEGCFVGH